MRTGEIAKELEKEIGYRPDDGLVRKWLKKEDWPSVEEQWQLFGIAWVQPTAEDLAWIEGFEERVYLHGDGRIDILEYHVNYPP